MTIRVLNDRLINQIAAGEVVERPSSVVKELVENSLDAHATEIQIEIEEGGQGLIRVTDNGSGIPADEMELAFTRHATSKLSREEDLESIMTMGFRGEALPSIASVSRVKIISSSDGLQGSKMELAGGQILSKELWASPQGTMIEIKDLFYNVPARRKFLKSPVTEASRVYNIVLQLAVSHPGVRFSYKQNDRLLFKTPGTGDLASALDAIKGAGYSNGFTAVESQSEYQLNGLISRPEYKRRNRREQVFLVNHRPVHSPLLLRAVDEAYRGRLVSGEYPACYLQLILPPADVDVNVHPQKTEVRFRDEDRVFRTVAGTIKRSLDQHNQKSWQPEGHGSSYKPPQINNIPSSQAIAEAAASIYAGALITAEDMTAEIVMVQPPAEKLDYRPDVVILGQVFNSYILVASGDNLLLIDQHAADESLRYHELLNSSELWAPQELLLPVTVKLSLRQISEFIAIQGILQQAGFSAEPIGDESLVLRSAPVAAKGREEEIFTWLLEDLFTGEIDVDEKEYFRRVVSSLACHEAIKANQQMHPLEIEILVKKLISNPAAAHCPHGRPTFVTIPQSKIAEWFKR